MTDIGQMLHRFDERLKAVERSSRLSSASIDDTALEVRDGTGSLRAVIGQQGDGTTGAVIVNGPPPPAPTVPVLFSILGGVEAQWDGQFAGGAVMPLDFSRVEVHAAIVGGFEPVPATLVSTIETPQGALTVIPCDTPVYVRLVARSTSGTASPPSAQVGPVGPTPVVAAGLLDGIVTTVKLADNAVNAAKIAVGAVGSTALADGAVLSDKLAAAAVSTGKLADNAVTNAKLVNQAVDAAKLATGAVGSTALADGAVLADKLATAAVTTGKLADQVISAAKLADEAVIAAKLAPGAVTATKILAGAVQAGAIAVDAVTAGKLAADSVTAREIVGGSVTASELAAGSVTASKMTIAGGTNVLADPSFEGLYTGSLVAAAGARWTQVAGGNGSTTALQVNAAGTSSSYALMLTEVPVLAGEQLYLASDVQVSADWVGAEVSIYARWESGTGAILGYGFAPLPTPPSDGSWARITATPTAPVGTVRAKVFVESKTSTAGTARWDNAAVRPVVTTIQIGNGAVIADKLAANSVIAGKIAANAVTAGTVNADAITARELAANSVTATEIAANAVTAAAIAAGTITAEKLTVVGAGNVLSDPSFEGAVTTALVAPLAFASKDGTRGNGSPSSLKIDCVAGVATNREVVLAVVPILAGDQLYIAVDFYLSADWVGTSVNMHVRFEDSAGASVAFGNASSGTGPPKGAWTRVVATVTAPANTVGARIRVQSIGGSAGAAWFDNAVVRPVVPGVQIADGAVTAPKIVANAVQAAAIAADAVSAGKIAAGAVTTAKLDALAVTADKIAANAITAGKILAGAVEAVAIAANAVTTDKLNAGAVTADKILAGAVKTVALDANAVTAGKIAAGAIESTHLSVGSIKPDQIAVGQGNNLVPDPSFEGAASANVIAAAGAPWSFAPGNRTGVGIRCDYDATAPTPAYYTLPLAVVPILPAAQLHLGVDILVADNYAAAGSKLLARWESATGAILGYGVAELIAPITGRWQRVSAQSAAPQGTARAVLALEVSAMTAGWAVFDNAEAITMFGRVSGGARAEVGPQGLRLYDETGEEAVSLVTGAPQYLTLRANGLAVATIDDTGAGNFTDLNVAGTFTVGGDPVSTLLGNTARGLVAIDYQITTVEAGNTEYGFVELGFEADPTRMYRVIYDGIGNPSVAGGELQLRLRDGGAAKPTITSTQLQASVHQLALATSKRVRLELTRPGSSYGAGVHRLLLTFRCTGGPVGQTVTLSGAAANPGVMYVEDVGPYIPETGGYNTGGGTGPDPVRTYTKTYAATWSGSYAKRAKYNAYYGNKCVQGYYGPTHGMQAALIGFPAALGTDLAGATIQKAEVYLYAEHWYNAGGGSVVIKAHGHAARPATFSSDAEAKTVTWSRNQGKWVDITSVFDSTAWRGIALDPNNTSKTYYGMIRGVGQAYPPQLRVSYSK